MRSILILTLVVTFSVAQDAPTPEQRDERVQVLLKNGHSLIGIAKSGIRCERLVRGNFKPCTDPQERSAGIRVWYYQDLDGYIFLETKQLDHVDVLGMLTSDESRALAEAVSAARGLRVYSVASSRPSDRKGAESRPGPELQVTPDEKTLLDRFPPEKGWSPEKFGELQRKKIVLHVTPSTEEQAFIENFPVFQGAWKKWLATQNQKQSEEGGNGDEKTAPAPSKGEHKKKN